MQILNTLLLVVAVILCCHTLVCWAAAPISSLSVTLRGQKYDLSDVTTVQDLQDKLEKESGVQKKQQGRLIFGGKRLDSEAVLSEAGIETGAQLNMVPSTSSSGKKKKSKPAASSTGTKNNAKTASADAAATPNNPMADYLKQSGIDTSKIDEMVKSMGGGGNNGGDGKAPSMEESLGAMKDVMNSPLFQQMMSDPERLEQSRQMILNNPMMKSMMGGMPGMDELLNDKDAFREAMQAAAEMYKNMDTDTLLQGIMGGAGGMANNNIPNNSLFDGTLDETSAKTAAALDELDEDE